MLTKEVQSFHVRNLVFRHTILPQGCTTFRLQRFHFIIDAKNKFSLIISNDWVYELHPSYPRDTHMKNKVIAKHPGLNYENIWNGSIWKRDWEFSNFRSRHRLRMSSWTFWTNEYKYEKQRNPRHTHTQRKMENKKNICKYMVHALSSRNDGFLDQNSSGNLWSHKRKKLDWVYSVYNTNAIVANFYRKEL